jgi:hypothetical protein
MLKSGSTTSDQQREHLAQVHALSQAVASAVAAIEKNDLPGLESHLADQETMCNRLLSRGEPSSGTEKILAASGDTLDAPLLQEIRQAYVALAQLNLVYSALLKRAQRSLALISALYRGHGAGYDRGSSELPQRHSWSCEV